MPGTSPDTVLKGKWQGVLCPQGRVGCFCHSLAHLGMAVPPLQVHLVLTFGISPPHHVFIFSPFCQQKKITLLPALSITEISTLGCNYKGSNEGISFASNASVGEN